MDKQQEIKTLQSLKGETYFNQFFSNGDIDRMCQNITNDLAIELDCDFNRKSVVLQKNLLEAGEYYRKEMKSHAEEIITALDGDIPECLYDVLWYMTGKIELIKMKREKGYKLTDKEIDYLIKEASK
jgi:hypothetical protein